MLQGRVEVFVSEQANKMTRTIFRFKFLNLWTEERTTPGTVGRQISNIWGLGNITIQVTVPWLGRDGAFAVR